MARSRNAEIADALLEAAARVLSEEGRDAVTARRLARDVGTSTMGLYTHFGSMDALLAALWREGFSRFGAHLDSPRTTDDALADLATQGWAYRRFARHNQHLYLVMFDGALLALTSPEDRETAAGTFLSLLARLERCRQAGDLLIDDVAASGQTVWALSHGHVSLELAGTFGGDARAAERAFEECIRRVVLGYGARHERVETALRAARRRARAAEKRP